MAMTMTQKILAAHCGEACVYPGQLINARLDIVLGNDITTPVAINEFEKAGFDADDFLLIGLIALLMGREGNEDIVLILALLLLV